MIGVQTWLKTDIIIAMTNDNIFDILQISISVLSLLISFFIINNKSLKSDYESPKPQIILSNSNKFDSTKCVNGTFQIIKSFSRSTYENPKYMFVIILIISQCIFQNFREKKQLFFPSFLKEILKPIISFKKGVQKKKSLQPNQHILHK